MARYRCAVAGCASSYNTRGVSFHRVPVNHDRRLKWLQALGIADKPRAATGRVCSLHFSASAYADGAALAALKRTAGYTIRRVLRPDAVPVPCSHDERRQASEESFSAHQPVSLLQESFSAHQPVELFDPVCISEDISLLSKSMGALDHHRCHYTCHAATQTDHIPDRELRSKGVQVALARKVTVTTGSQANLERPPRRMP